MLLFYVLISAILLMGIGYASINSITGEIQGTVIAEVQDGVFIANVELDNNVDANLSTSQIHKYMGTMMQNTVKLSETNPNSEITYKVTVYNNSNESCIFLDTLYDESNVEFYSNPNIIFEIKDNGFKVGDIINSKETKDIYITFKYKDGVVPENTVLNSYLNFRIKVLNRLVAAQSVAATGNYLGSSVVKNKIETIKFELGEAEPEGTKSSFDASKNKDKSIMGYYTDINNNGLYELNFLSDEKIFTNTDVRYLFQNLTNLKNISFDNFSTYGAKYMEEMFAGCSALTAIDANKFDTSEVITMNSMFKDCSSLAELKISNFDTNNVTNMFGMFRGCKSLVELNLSNFNTSKVQYMNYMFDSCSSLTTLDVSKFDTKNVKYINNMFSMCQKLTSLELSNFNTSSTTNLQSMFYYCSSLTTLNLTKFDTSNLTDMTSMFEGCSKLTTLDLSKFDTSNVTTMELMFKSCSSLTTLDLSSFNTSKVQNMSKMFFICSSLKTIYVSEFNAGAKTGWTTLAVTNSNQMFTTCNNIEGGNGTTFDWTHTDATYARIDNKPGEPGYFTKK